jgi:NADPH:quinone reductase-like Zn-dependent oxidoreductase
MKAIVQRRYGRPADVLAFESVPDPEVGPDDVLVKVEAAAVNPAEWHIVRGQPYVARLSLGLRQPEDHGPGSDVAGRIEAVGGNVTRLKVGDAVFGCLFDDGRAGFAQYVSAPHNRFQKLPSTMTASEAAAIPVAGLTALQALRTHGGVTPDQRVLIVGASGGVGGYAVQIAKSMGAHVTGVCSEASAEYVRSLGADDVMAYTSTDYTDPATAAEPYDLIIQLGGTKTASSFLGVLDDNGTILMLGGEGGGKWLGPIARVVGGFVRFLLVKPRLAVFTAQVEAEDLAYLAHLAETGRLRTTIDRTYELSDAAEAIEYVEQGHTRGKVVLTV